MKRILIFILLSSAIFSCSTKKAEISYKLPAPEDVVMYQVNPRVFAPENSLQAVIPHLDSIKSLGANVVWIMPVYPIGKVKSKNSPYSISDYKAVNPEFGTLEDFKTLVVECHKRGMAFIMDWVANHTAWDNVWMEEHKDWYTCNSEGEVIFPEGTDWTDVADLNYDNYQMRAAMIDAMLYWVKEIGVDGFRCDVADFVPSGFWAEAITSIRSEVSRPVLMLAEGNDPKTFEGGFDMNYAWDYMNTLREVFCEGAPASKLIEADFEEYSKLPEGKIKLRFISNHDEAAKKSTVEEFGGKEGAIAAFVSTIFTKGAALVYGSQEVAHPSAINFFKYEEVDWKSNNEIRQEYRALLRIFKENPVLHKAVAKPFPSDDVLLYEKRGEAENYLVIVNVRNSVVSVDIPSQWRSLPLSDLVTGQPENLGEKMQLKPYGYRILKNIL